MGEVKTTGIGYIDGRYCPKEELCIPVTDLGFLLCDTTYDALHVRDGAFFRLEDHLQRFERSIGLRRFTTFPHSRDEVREIVTECVRRAGLREAMVMLVATRGDQVGYSKDLRTCRNRFIAWAAPYYGVATQEEMRDGVSLIVSSVRRIPPESVDPTIKNFGRLDFCAAMLEAYDRGSAHAVLLDGEGNVTEGRGWNLFAYRNGEMVSPEAGVLEGITRRTIMELAERGNVKARLGRISERELKAAEEVFITSSAGGVIPVIRIDDAPIGDGSPGPLCRRLSALYWEAHGDPRYATPISYEAVTAE